MRRLLIRVWYDIGQFTSNLEKRGKWYVTYIEEIPGVNTPGPHTRGGSPQP